MFFLCVLFLASMPLFLIISFLSLVPLLFRLSFYVSVLVRCPYVLMFPFLSLIPLTLKVFFLCLLVFPLLFFFRIITGASLVPLLFNFSFYIYVIVGCPSVVIFSLFFPNAHRFLNFLSMPTFIHFAVLLELFLVLP